MTTLPGIQKWNAKDLDEKEALDAKVPSAIVGLTRTELPDEYLLADFDTRNIAKEISLHQAAQNAIFSWLDFPEKLEKYINAIIGMALDEGSRKFSAVNLDLALQIRIGRGASDEYPKKWITDKKKQLQKWQSFNNIELVKVEDGKFDAKKKKNNPTVYQVHIVDMMIETVLLAKDDPKWITAYNSYLKNKVIRRAARQVVIRAKESPLVKEPKDRSLSEEEKFDRRHRLILSSMVKNREFLNSLGMTYEDYFLFLVGEMDRIATNPAGAKQLLTPSRDEANHHISVFEKIKTGEIVEEIDRNSEHLDKKLSMLESLKGDRVEYGAIAVREEQREIKTPRVWQDGKFVEVSNTIETKDAETAPENDSILSDGHFFSEVLKTDPKPLKTQGSSDGHFEPKNDPVLSTFSEAESEVVEGTISANVEGTFFDNAPVVEDDFTDRFVEAAQLPEVEPSMTDERMQKIFDAYVSEVKTKVPDKSAAELWKGAWQVYLDLEFATDKQSAALRKMESVRDSVVRGESSLSDFRAAFVEWVVEGATFYQNGTIVPQSYERRKLFRDRLEQHLKATFDDG